MKIHLLFLMAVAVAVSSCVKDPILIESVVDEKAKMDQADNPAMKFLINEELGKREVHLFSVVVKDVTPSTNIDYDFCVIADVQTKKGPVECHIYSTDVKTVSGLVKGKTRINAVGDFGRFFSLLDNYYTRLEIIKATITPR
jgi:hypothetical protein